VDAREQVGAVLIADAPLARVEELIAVEETDDLEPRGRVH
jgi:hypothetical protein